MTNNIANQAPLQENPVMRTYRKYQILGSYQWPNPANYVCKAELSSYPISKFMS